MTARRAVLVALAGGALVAGPASPAVDQQQPTQVIDAGSNADLAAKTLNEGCADMSKCDWKSDNKWTYSVPDATNPGTAAKIIGDAMYNCSPDHEGVAEVGIETKDTREEATSISESVSLEISLGFLELEKASAEFKVFSQQSSKYETSTTISTATQVKAGYRGWNAVGVITAAVSGSAYITDGINLIQVKGIQLTFPGFKENSAQQGLIVYNQSRGMSPVEYEQHCASFAGVTGSAARAARTTTQARPTQAGPAQAGPAQWHRTYQIAVCRSADRSRPRCTKRRVTGLTPPSTHRSGVTATLTRFGQVYAVETDRGGAMQLTQRRDITPGRYQLIMHARPKKITLRSATGKRHSAMRHNITTIPVTIGWTQRK